MGPRNHSHIEHVISDAGRVGELLGRHFVTDASACQTETRTRSVGRRTHCSEMCWFLVLVHDFDEGDAVSGDVMIVDERFAILLRTDIRLKKPVN